MLLTEKSLVSTVSLSIPHQEGKNGFRLEQTRLGPTAQSRIRGSHFVSGQMVVLSFTVTFLTVVSFPRGKPDDCVGHVDYVPTVFHT